MARRIAYILGAAAILSVAAAAYPLVAGPSAPATTPLCIYNSSLPTLTDGQFVQIQCDTNGKILVH